MANAGARQMRLIGQAERGGDLRRGHAAPAQPHHLLKARRQLQHLVARVVERVMFDARAEVARLQAAGSGEHQLHAPEDE